MIYFDCKTQTKITALYCERYSINIFTFSFILTSNILYIIVRIYFIINLQEKFEFVYKINKILLQKR